MKEIERMAKVKEVWNNPNTQLDLEKAIRKARREIKDSNYYDRAEVWLDVRDFLNNNKIKTLKLPIYKYQQNNYSYDTMYDFCVATIGKGIDLSNAKRQALNTFTQWHEELFLHTIKEEIHKNLKNFTQIVAILEYVKPFYKNDFMGGIIVEEILAYVKEKATDDIYTQLKVYTRLIA